MTKHNTLITLCVLNNVLLTLTILLLPIISSFTIIHNTNTNNNNNLSSRLISLSSRSSSNLDTDDDDDDDTATAAAVDNNKYKGLIQKYQRRSHLLEEALIKERNVTRKFRTRVKLLEQKQLLLLWNNNKNDDSSSSSKLFEAASVVHLIDNEKEVELNDRSDQRQRYYRRLEIQEEEFNRMLKEKTVLLNQLSKLKLQLKHQSKQSEEELNEIEGALFKVEKELKAERLYWHSREEELVNKVKMLMDEVVSLEEGSLLSTQVVSDDASVVGSMMSESSSVVSTHIIKKVEEEEKEEEDDTQKVEEEQRKQIKILSKRVALLQEQLTRQRQIGSIRKVEQSSLQDQVQRRIFRERDIEICCYGAADVIGIGSAASVVTNTTCTATSNTMMAKHKHKFHKIIINSAPIVRTAINIRYIFIIIIICLIPKNGVCIYYDLVKFNKNKNECVCVCVWNECRYTVFV